jgi:hypothetical protein
MISRSLAEIEDWFVPRRSVLDVGWARRDSAVFFSVAVGLVIGPQSRSQKKPRKLCQLETPWLEEGFGA